MPPKDEFADLRVRDVIVCMRVDMMCLLQMR